MTTTLATLTATWTDNSNTVHDDQVLVIGPTAVPDPDVPVVILLHGHGSDMTYMSQPALTKYTFNMAAPIVSPMDLGIMSYPIAGIYGFATDGQLSPPPAGWQPFLIGEGCITLNYTQVEPLGGVGLVNGQPSDLVRQLQAIVTSVTVTFPGRRIAFVTHSRGGLLLRAWLVQYGSDPAVRPRLGTVVQLASPNQGSDLASIVTALADTVAAIAVTTASFALPALDSLPLYQLIAGSIAGPGIVEMQVGSDFLTWLASKEPDAASEALLELHTFGGTNSTLTRLHLYVFTLQCVVPIITWEGIIPVVTYHWYAWDLGIPVRNFVGDIGAALQAPPEIVPGTGDIMVTAKSASLLWQAGYHVNPVNHAQPLWDGQVMAEALPVLKSAWGSPAVQVAACWAVWNQPASVLAGASFAITVTVTNVGTVTWPSGCTVGADDGAANRIWGAATAAMASTVARGASETVTINLTAPSVPGGSHLNVFVAEPGGQQLERGQPSQGIVVVPQQPGLEVFAVGPDGKLGHTWQLAAGGWSAWTDLGPAITGDPAVSQNADGRLEVFAKGADGNLGHAWQTLPGGGWSAWTDLGPAITSNPAVFRNADGRLEVFANGPAPAGPPALGHIWQLTPGGGWSAWADFGTIPGEWSITGDPAVFQNADGRLEVFAKGPDGNLGHIWQNVASTTTSWSGWADLGPAIIRNPAVFRNADGRLEVFANGPVAAGPPALGHIWQLTPGGGWSAWADFGTIPGEWSITGDPAVFQNADGRLEVFAKGPDGNLGHIWQNVASTTTSWSGWADLGPAITSNPAAAAKKTGA